MKEKTKVNYYFDYDGIVYYKCPFCDNFDLEILEYGFKIVCKKCKKSAVTNFISNDVLSGLKNIHKFYHFLSYELIDKHKNEKIEDLILKFDKKGVL